MELQACVSGVTGGQQSPQQLCDNMFVRRAAAGLAVAGLPSPSTHHAHATQHHHFIPTYLAGHDVHCLAVYSPPQSVQQAAQVLVLCLQGLLLLKSQAGPLRVLGGCLCFFVYS